MAASRTKGHRSGLAKSLLRTEARIREQAAWELLYAVNELFPECSQELRALGDRLVSELHDEADEDDRDNREAADRFRRAVSDWTAKNNISCDAVNRAAATYAVDDGPTEGLYIDAHFDENGEPVFHDTPSITAYPYNQTREEFLEQAGLYYDALAQTYVDRDGATSGPTKRGRDHFRYLVAHLVGGYSFAEIAYGDTPLNLPTAEQQTVAGGARNVAKRLGISLPTKRGPRKGSRRHRRLPGR